MITHIKNHQITKVTAIAHYDEYVREKRLFLLVKRFQDMILRKLYESEYEEWNSEDDEENGDWEWVWEDEEEENQGEQMQTLYILLWLKISLIHFLKKIKNDE